MIYITGDRHGQFADIALFCRQNQTKKEDIMIIVGDAGINYYGVRDRPLKQYLQNFPITFFSIQGNHEERPFNIPGYKLQPFHGGEVYVEEEFPNLLFAKDGEIYNFEGLNTVVIGGAYSIDKHYRIEHGYMWFKDEQPSKEIKKEVEATLDRVGWDVDVVLTHTAPIHYEPTEWFLDFVDQSRVDKSTEEWLDTIEKRLKYKKWYMGHYHGSKKIDKLQFLYNEIIPFKI